MLAGRSVASQGLLTADSGSVGASLLLWLGAGLLAWTGASSFAELVRSHSNIRYRNPYIYYEGCSYTGEWRCSGLSAIRVRPSHLVPVLMDFHRGLKAWQCRHHIHHIRRIHVQNLLSCYRQHIEWRKRTRDPDTCHQASCDSGNHGYSCIECGQLRIGDKGADSPNPIESELEQPAVQSVLSLNLASRAASRSYHGYCPAGPGKS